MPTCPLCEKYGWEDPQPSLHPTEIEEHEGRTPPCIFHAPADHPEKQDVENFNAHVEERVKATQKAKIICNLSGTIFPGDISFRQLNDSHLLPAMNLKETFFQGNVDFSGKTINGNIDFSNGEVKGNSNLSYTVIKGLATFFKSTIHGDSLFLGASVDGWVDYAHSINKRNVNFWNSHITGGVRFTCSIIEGEINFFNAIILKGAFFGEATIKKICDFRVQKVEGGISFINASIGNEAKFQHSTILGKTQFMGASIKEEFRFDHMDVEESDFSNTSFGGEAHFSHTGFKGYTCYWKSKFEKKATFSGASFCSNVNFNHAYFLDHVYLNDIPHGRTISFNHAEFHRPLHCINSRVEGISCTNTLFVDGASFSHSSINFMNFMDSYPQKPIYFNHINMKCIPLGSAPIESFRFRNCKWPKNNDLYKDDDSKIENIIQEYVGTIHRFKNFTILPFRWIKQHCLIFLHFIISIWCDIGQRHIIQDQIKFKSNDISTDEMKELSETYQRLKVIAINSKDFQLASDWHHNEKYWQLRSMDSPLRRNFFSVLFWYRLFSGFGEDPRRSLFWLLAFLFLPPVTMALLGFWITREHLWGPLDWDLVHHVFSSWAHCIPFIKVPRISQETPGLLTISRGFFQLLITLQGTFFGFALRNRFRR